MMCLLLQFTKIVFFLYQCSRIHINKEYQIEMYHFNEQLNFKITKHVLTLLANDCHKSRFKLVLKIRSIIEMFMFIAIDFSFLINDFCLNSQILSLKYCSYRVYFIFCSCDFS